MISDLSHSGMTYAAIAEHCGCALSTIGDLATGRSRQPSGNSALKLKALHDKLLRAQARKAAAHRSGDNHMR